MSAPSVSVLMTAYNRERYIAAAIESVLAQTFADFELVVVDDCSTDATVDIARRYISDSRVRLIVNARNLGDYANRNHAATLARGEFIKYHDSDDVMYPHALDVMVKNLRGVPRAAVALTSSSSWAGGPAPMLLTPRLAYEREFFGQGLFRVGPGCALFRAEAWRRLGGFPELGPVSDTVFWMRVCAREHVLLVPGDLFWYRIHPGQELQSPRAAFAYAAVDRFSLEALASADCPLDDRQRRLARRNVTFGVAKKVSRDLRARRFRLAAHRVARCGVRPLDWIRYLRAPVRDWNAGTPLAADGEFIVPALPPHGPAMTR